MFTVRDILLAENLDEAYQSLISKRNNTILGGCAYLRMGSKRIGTAIDLSGLNLDYIKVNGEEIAIGAMATLRQVETNPVLNQVCPALSQALRNILGVQFRNTATIGASVFAKYGFSDVLTALLAFDCDVVLHHGGRMSLELFLQRPYVKDILVEVIIKRNGRKTAFQNLRNAVSDYAILNVAVSCLADNWKIAVGARPQKAKLATKAADFLQGCRAELTIETIEKAAAIAADELPFGSNMRATGAYRQAVGRVLVKRAISEVISCK